MKRIDADSFPYPILLLLLMILGTGAFFYTTQLREGLAVTGLNSQVNWGIYIVNFIFCVGLSAGGIAVSGLVHAFRNEKLKPVALIAEVLAFAFLVMAAFCILLDLGRPERAWFVIRHANVWSPLVWDMIVINLYLILCMALLWCSIRAELWALPGDLRGGRIWKAIAGVKNEESCRRNERMLGILSMISIPAALALHSVTAWILGLAKGQPGWNTAILAPLFIASALVSGIGVVILGAGAARRYFGIPIPADSIVKLGRYLMFLLPLLIYLLLSEFLTISYAGEASHRQVMEEIIWGKFAPFFWFDMVVGILVPFFLLGFLGRFQWAIQTAAFLAVVGVLAERVNILLPSLMRPGHWHGEASYLPSLPEVLMVGAVYAFGLLIFCGFSYFWGRLLEQRDLEGARAAEMKGRLVEQHAGSQ